MMEAYDEEFYHAYITRTGVRVGGPTRSVSVSRGTKTNSDGTWKKHKYVYKEGNKYIYPEDLQKARKGPASILSTSSSNTGSGRLGTNAGSAHLNNVSNKKPRSRIKNVTGKSSDISLRGEGLKTGPVGTGTGRRNSKVITRSNPMFDDDSTGLEKADEFLYDNSLKYRILSDGVKAVGSVANKVYNQGKKFVDTFKQNKNTPKKYNRTTSAASVLDNTSSSKPDPYVEDVFNALTYVLDNYDRRK